VPVLHERQQDIALGNQSNVAYDSDGSKKDRMERENIENCYVTRKRTVPVLWLTRAHSNNFKFNLKLKWESESSESPGPVTVTVNLKLF
jgi:hypothetical protein